MILWLFLAAEKEPEGDHFDLLKRGISKANELFASGKFLHSSILTLLI